VQRFDKKHKIYKETLSINKFEKIKKDEKGEYL